MRRDYDPDLERDDFEERELNAGGVRAKRIREQHDAEDEAQEPYCPWCTDGIDPGDDWDALCEQPGCKPRTTYSTPGYDYREETT